MNYFMPVPIYAEENCVAHHAEELCALGTRALLVTGKTSAEKNGSLKDVRAVLDAHGIPTVHFSEIEENPSVETVMRARDIGVREKVDFVIGIGGGSPMDAAKAIALMIRHGDRDASYLYTEGSSDALPIVLIPTTCGTGSEVTAISVLTRHDKQTKISMTHRVFAQLALLDGRYLEALPQHVLADTTMDAFAHLTESYINTGATDFSRMCVDAGLKIWRRSKDVLLQQRAATSEDYQNMLNASAMAGMAIAQDGTVLPHGLSYALTYHTGMPHGRACGYFLPGFLREADSADRSYILETAGFSSLDAFAEYFAQTCSCEKISSEILEFSVQDLLQTPAKLAKTPFPTDAAVLRRIAGIH